VSLGPLAQQAFRRANDPFGDVSPEARALIEEYAAVREPLPRDD
jgi:hypothetical protein